MELICSEWRCKIPSDSLNAEHAAGRTPHTAQLYYLPTAIDWNHIAVQRELGKADVLVFQRNILFREVWDAMDYWRALGKCVVVDLDDFYQQLPPSNPAHEYWVRNRGGITPPPVEALVEGMKHADAVTSPSKVILADWAHILPGYWIPNWTRRAWYERLNQKLVGAPDMMLVQGVNAEGTSVLNFAIRPESEGQIMIGWGGSISHVDSWIYSGVIEALDKIFAKHPQAMLKFCGHESRIDYLLNRWPGRVIRQGGVAPEFWPQVVSTFDIGVAPLDTRPLDPPWREGAPVASYDERRSWLKGAEYLTAGVPWVGSRSETYNDLSRYGALVDNTPDAWFAALDKIIGNLAFEKGKAWDRRTWAMRNITFESNANKYGDIFGRIIAEKNAKMQVRLPGITYVQAKQEAVAA